MRIAEVRQTARQCEDPWQQFLPVLHKNKQLQYGTGREYRRTRTGRIRRAEVSPHAEHADLRQRICLRQVQHRKPGQLPKVKEV